METTEKLKVINRLGLHLRAAAQLVKTASRFKCRILIRNNHQEVNCKSLINLMALAATYGSEVYVTFEGDDALDAVKAIQHLFLNKFGEKE